MCEEKSKMFNINQKQEGNNFLSCTACVWYCEGCAVTCHSGCAFECILSCVGCTSSCADQCRLGPGWMGNI